MYITVRFVMNSQLVTAGYPWVVIPVEYREEYMAALEKASVEGDVEGFGRFVGGYWEVDGKESSLMNSAVIQKIRMQKIHPNFVAFLQKQDLFIDYINIFIIFAAELKCCYYDTRILGRELPFDKGTSNVKLRNEIQGG